MNFTIQGAPYSGVFNVSLKITTQISTGEFSKNLGNFHGIFLHDDNI